MQCSSVKRDGKRCGNPSKIDGKCGVHNKKSSLQIRDNTVFLSGKRRDNGKDNEKRENRILELINSSSDEELNREFRMMFSNYTSIRAEKKGGRHYNYDFDLIVTYPENVIREKLEYKWSKTGKGIYDLPQILNIYTSSIYKELSYQEFFYDKYIKDLSVLMESKEEIPSKEEYLNLVKRTSPNGMWFCYIKTVDKTSDSLRNNKKILVDESITKYIDLYRPHCDQINQILEKAERLYLCQNEKGLSLSRLTKDDLTCRELFRVEKNKLIYSTVSGKKIHLMLRWKNGAGVLNPAWQISIRK